MLNIVTGLRSNTISLINGCSNYTKLLSVLFILSFCFSYIPNTTRYVAVTPGLIFPPNFWLWTLLTFSFYHNSLVILILDISAIFLVDKMLLPIWGSFELLKFCLIVNLISVVLTSFSFYFVYFLTFHIESLFHTHICGLLSLFAALTVAVRQLMPDNVLANFPNGKMRNKHLSFSIFIILIILKFVSLASLESIFTYTYGIVVSWVYLRFFQKHTNGNKGDMGDGFTFAGFFPNHLEPPVAILSNTVFSLLVKFKICKKIDRRYDISKPTTISLTITSGDPADAERRKQLALKALNDRLNRPDKSASIWPSLLEEDNSSPPVVVESSKEVEVTPEPKSKSVEPPSITTKNDESSELNKVTVDE